MKPDPSDKMLVSRYLCSIYQRCQHYNGFTRVTLYMCIHCWVHSQLKSSMKFHLRTIPVSPSSWILAILMHRRLTQERDLTISLKGVVYIFEILVAVINTSFMIFFHQKIITLLKIRALSCFMCIIL